jgi:hypothetical protein
MYRQAYRSIQAEDNAQGWGALLAVLAAGGAAWLTWSHTGTPVPTLAAALVAAAVGYAIGYKFALFFQILLGVAVIGFGVLVFIGYQVNKKAEEQAVFDPHSLSTTLLWLKAEGQKVAEVDQKKNEVLSKEALEGLSRKLAGVEGTQVCWEAPVESVRPSAVTLQSSALQSSASSVTLRCEVIADKQYPATAQAEPAAPGVLPVTPEQGRRLAAGHPVAFSGRILACKAERSVESLVITLRVAEARVAD